jgi:hypothetical protein
MNGLHTDTASLELFRCYSLNDLIRNISLQYQILFCVKTLDWLEISNLSVLLDDLYLNRLIVCKAGRYKADFALVSNRSDLKYLDDS